MKNDWSDMPPEMLEEIEEIHDLSRKVRTVNGETAICPECGYVLTEFNGE